MKQQSQEPVTQWISLSIEEDIKQAVEGNVEARERVDKWFQDRQQRFRSRFLVTRKPGQTKEHME